MLNQCARPMAVLAATFAAINDGVGDVQGDY